MQKGVDHCSLQSEGGLILSSLAAYNATGAMCSVTLPGCDATQSRSSMGASYVQLTDEPDTCTARDLSQHPTPCIIFGQIENPS